MARKFSGNIKPNETAIILLNQRPDEVGFQISVAGDVVSISTLEPGLPSSIDQTQIQDQGIIFDLMGVSVVKLSSTGGAGSTYTLRTRNDLVSTPGDNWETIYA